MQKTVTYLYPDASRASHLKVFQDRTNQIKSFYFTKDNLKEIEKLDTSSNYAVYFLFDNSDTDQSKVYVGQSVNGIYRINEHVKNKDFWSFCIMFVTDNNSFDKLAIDFMEYAFINKLRKSSYVLMNKDMRVNAPIVSIYDKPNLLAFMEQIEFLLSAEGITIDEPLEPEGEEKYYYPKSKEYKDKAKIIVKDGFFILLKGSIIRRPDELSKAWKSDRHYLRYNKIIDEYVSDEKVVKTNEGYELTVNLSFASPTMPAGLITGSSRNGWSFFTGLNELRKIDEGGINNGIQRDQV